MDYDSHPLSQYLSTIIDLLLENVREDKIQAPLNLFDIDHIIPINYGISDGFSKGGKPIENSPLAFKSVLKDSNSSARNRSYIYDLIYSTPIDSVDIGSGDFEKGLESYKVLNYYNGPSRLLLDKIDSGRFPLFDTLDTEKINFRRFDMNEQTDQAFLERFMEQHPKFLITAVNSLMYKKSDLSPFDNYDMLYTLPNPKVMLQQGAIIMLDARKYRFVISGEEEYSYQEKLDSEPNEMQSLAVNMAIRKIEVKKLSEEEMTEEVEDSNLYLDLNKRPVRLSKTVKGTFIGPFYKKMDGLTMVISRRGGFLYTKTAFEYNVYHVREIEGGGPYDNFEIEGEYISEAEVLVLHSVRSLGKLKLPAFMKKVEKEFCEKYRIFGLPFAIYSKRAYDTVDHCLLDKEIFGNCVVTRAEGVLGFVEGKRHMVAGKVMETLDINPELASKLKTDFEDNYGQEIHVVNLAGGICEYSLCRLGDIIYLKANKLRLDKTEPNNYERCVEMIMSLMLSESHDLVEYMSEDVLVEYGITSKN